MTKLAADEIAKLDPYKFMAVIGKRVIHPGGRASTDELLARAHLSAVSRVLDVGCGVDTTAIEIAKRYGAHVSAVDVAPLMLERAEANMAIANVAHLVTVEHADILDLKFPDNTFDVVIAEAVTKFVDRRRAAAELARVTTPGGRVLETEFFWRANHPHPRHERSSSARSVPAWSSTPSRTGSRWTRRRVCATSTPPPDRSR
jgi:ubiquinone/menaquinone biosynthesis C-methylase UbiE